MQKKGTTKKIIDKKELSKKAIFVGSILSAIATTGSALETFIVILSDTGNILPPYLKFSYILRCVFIALGTLGISAIIYAQIDHWRRNRE